MTTRHFLAPAKINLCLHVLRRRADGYHDLAMLMQRVSLFDAVSLTLSPLAGVRVTCSGLDLAPGEENIAARAARSLLARADFEGGVDVHIDKKIPVAAGLGGGSSDAAAVLLGLNEMLGRNLTRQELITEGGRLGADVPFFVFQGSAWATGIGDVLENVPALPPVHYVLVNPGLAVSTAWVYQNLRLTSGGDVAKIPGFPVAEETLVRMLHNDLEQVTVERYPVVAEIKQRLLAVGALGALMSGSGPTVFGVFSDRSTAERVCRELERNKGWRVFAVSPV